MIDKIINWAEVWGLLIPLFIIVFFRPRGNRSGLLVWYVIIALLLNIIATVMVEFYFSMPDWLRNNNILYNIHSIVRAALFSWYLIMIRNYKYRNVLFLMLAGYTFFVTFSFIFIASPLFINTYIFTAESILLILLCLSFFFRSMQDDSETNWMKHPAFLVATAVSLYEATSFFIFLFFYPLFEKNPEFGDLTLSIHNIMYVIFCILLGMALYKSRSRLQQKRFEN